MRILVDGMQIESSLDLPGMRTESNRPPEWWVGFERAPASSGLGGVAWTGDVRYEGLPWARFGRRGGERVVLLEGDASVVADPGNATAKVRHEHDDDAHALRRVAPYLASLSGAPSLSGLSPFPGRLALHAAAISFPRAAIFVGEAGAGKSTLALAMDRAHVPVLADDHVTVDAPPSGLVYAHASWPSVSVVRETLAAFGLEADAHGEGKTFLPLRALGRGPGERLQGIAFLERGPAVEYVPMRPADAVARLLKDAVFVADPANDQAHAARLDACVRLVAQAPPFTLVVPDGIDHLLAALPEIARPWGGLRRAPPGLHSSREIP